MMSLEFAEGHDIRKEIVAAFRQGTQRYLASAKHKPEPVHTNRISGLDDPCARRLYYNRAAWDKKAETDDGLQGIFETGHELEPVIKRILSKIGAFPDTPFRVVGSDNATTDKLFAKHKISGRIDGLLQLQFAGEWITVCVLDIKTSSPNVFASLSDYDSLEKYPWTRKYRGQLMMYALGNNLPLCLIIFVNKGNLLDIKPILFDLDYDYAEGLLKKAEAVNKAVDAGKPPDKINDPSECRRCAFESHCCPEVKPGPGVTISMNEELETTLLGLQELAVASATIKRLEKRRDEMLVKGQDTVIGDFLVKWKLIKGTRKPSPGGPYEQHRKKIQYLKEQPDA